MKTLKKYKNKKKHNSNSRKKRHKKRTYKGKGGQDSFKSIDLNTPPKSQSKKAISPIEPFIIPIQNSFKSINLNSKSPLLRNSPASYKSIPFVKNNLMKEKSEKEENIKTLEVEPAIDDSSNIALRDFLQNICVNSNYCMAFGLEKEKLLNYFSFDTFKYAKTPMTILSHGANGTVLALEYDRLNYKAFTIMKISMNKDADNLFPEAYNGIVHINDFNKFYPCFIETYGFFKMKKQINLNRSYRSYSSLMMDDSFMNINDITRNDLINEFDKIDIERFKSNPSTINENNFLSNLLSDYTQSSCNSLTNALLVQYIEKPMSLRSWIITNINQDWFGVELSQLLFQIYSALSSLNMANGFTHYDLHSDNVLLYILPNTIQMYYETAFGEYITIQSKYIVKIIDYGRVYTKSNILIYKNVCKNYILCRENIPDKGMCGTHVGYGFMIEPHYWNGIAQKMKKENSEVPGSEIITGNFYINALVPNRSHDLRLIVDVMNSIDKILRYNRGLNKENIINRNPISKALFMILNNTKYDTEYGTLEETDSVSYDIDDIFNYIDFYKYKFGELVTPEERNMLSEFKKINPDFKIKTVLDAFYALYALLSLNNWKEANKRYIIEQFGESSVRCELNVDLNGERPMIYKNL